MEAQEELNFRRFEEIYPKYRDMGAKVKREFRNAQDIDLFNSKQIESLTQEVAELKAENITLQTQVTCLQVDLGKECAKNSNLKF